MKISQSAVLDIAMHINCNTVLMQQYRIAGKFGNEQQFAKLKSIECFHPYKALCSANNKLFSCHNRIMVKFPLTKLPCCTVTTVLLISKLPNSLSRC